MSNVIKVKTGLVSLLLILIYATTPTLADDNQGSIIVDEIVEWTTDQDIGQNVHITSGGKLTISSSVTFTSTSTITIDEGGELILSDAAEIKSEKRATSLKTLGAIDEVNRSKIIIPTSIYSGDINVVINAEVGTSLDGSKVYLENMEPTDMNGMNFSLIIPESEEDTTLGFTGYGQFPIIKTIVIETDMGDIEYKANELPYQNMLLHGENGLTIDCAGKLEIIENSSILGVNVISSGEITIKEGIIKDSSPMILTSNDASFIIQNSEFSGSKEDHYVQAQPFTNIDWGDAENNTQVSIKGDLIDRWERIISNQEIKWLSRRAKDGFGIITTAATHVSKYGQGWEGEFGVFEDSFIDRLTLLTKNIHKYDSLIFAQLFHGGMRAPEKLTGQVPISASIIPSDLSSTGFTEAASIKQIEQLIFDFSSGFILIIFKNPNRVFETMPS